MPTATFSKRTQAKPTRTALTISQATISPSRPASVVTKRTHEPGSPQDHIRDHPPPCRASNVRHHSWRHQDRRRRRANPQHLFRFQPMQTEHSSCLSLEAEG
jgi:hypothetical protein